jgi:hypothetical protein
MVSLQIAISSHCYSVNRYKNLKNTIIKFNSNIYFNKQCTNSGLVTQHARIKVPNTSPTTKFFNTKFHKLRVQEETQFLYMKKLTIQYDLYRMHLQLPNEWKSSWDLINPLLPERRLCIFLLLAEHVPTC